MTFRDTGPAECSFVRLHEAWLFAAAEHEYPARQGVVFDDSPHGGNDLATPPEFRGGLVGYWSPEDLLVAAACSCFVLTLAAVAERREAPLLDATVSATGHMSRRDDGRFGFTLIELDAVLETIPGGEEAVCTAATVAEERCLIAQALDVPIHLAVDVTTARPSSDLALH